MAGPNFPAALAIQPAATRAAGSGAEAWRHDSAADIAQFGIAGRIWESAFLLLGYLDGNAPWTFDPPCSLHSGQVVTAVELGAGVGTVGLATAAQLQRVRSVAPHTVVLTDLDEVCPLMQRNAQASAAAHSDVRVAVRALPWGDTRAAEALLGALRQERGVRDAASNPVTHVLCSDLVYFPELLAPLLRTLIALTAGECGPEVVVGYKVRSLTKEQPFWTAFGAWFDMLPVECRAPGERESHVFGSLASHTGRAPAAAARGGQAPADGEFFVFIARRRPATLAATPPASDALLLAGQKVVRYDGGQEIYDPDHSGTDTFEWLMLGRLE